MRHPLVTTIVPRALLSTLAACAVLALAAPNAIAGLTYAGCLTAGTSPAAGCTDLSGSTNALAGPVGAVVSPDGRHLYTGAVGDAVAHFTRDTTSGAIAFGDCVTSGPSPALGCTDLSAQTSAIEYLQDIAMSPDGTSIYVVGYYADAITHLVRNPTTGALSFGGCVAGRAVTGCTNVAGATNALDELRGVAVSPDGASVYVTAGARDAVLRFDRNATSGALTYAACVTSDGAATGCSTTAPGVLDIPSPVTVSPDGRSVYVGTLTASTIVHFVRASNGALSSATSTTLAMLDHVNAVTVSPDGGSVYATSNFGGALVRFTRDAATGEIAFADCLTGGFSPAPGCTDLGPNAEAMSSPGDPLVAADGGTLYATGSSEVLRFARAASGALTFQECLTSDNPFGPAEGCTEISPRTDTLYGTVFVALSPDGASLYAGSFFNDAIATFATGAGGGSGDGGGSGGDTGGSGDTGGGSGGTTTPATPTPAPNVAPTISDLTAHRHARGRIGLHVTLSEDASVRIALERVRPGRMVHGVCRRQTRRNRRSRACRRFQQVGSFTAGGHTGSNEVVVPAKLRGRALPAGTYRATLTATDAAGAVSAPAQVAFRLVRR
jgi:6-phosphogluconolactonase (cycloisomerase 2 family)